MDVLFNERSIRGQFSEPAPFLRALDALMEARKHTKQRGMLFRCHRGFMQAPVNRESDVRGFVHQYLDRNKKRALLVWMDKEGPFWEDERRHSSDDWLELRSGEIVTDTAIGEAAVAAMQGESPALWSVTPSDWTYSPITVRDDSHNEVDIDNTWRLAALIELLNSAESPPRTWDEVLARAKRTCPHLQFSDSVLDALAGWPFSESAAKEVQRRLEVLNELRACADAHGEWDAKGKERYHTYFTGDKSWFSDSSDTEKNRFRKQLTFPHPDIPGESIFCPWHGKVKIQQLRIHFNFSMSRDHPLYVVYIGPKITKK